MGGGEGEEIYTSGYWLMFGYRVRKERRKAGRKREDFLKSLRSEVMSFAKIKAFKTAIV